MSGHFSTKRKIAAVSVLAVSVLSVASYQAQAAVENWTKFFSFDQIKTIRKTVERSIRGNFVNREKDWEGVVSGYAIKNGSIDSEDIADGSVAAADLASDNCSSGQVLKFNGSSWACAADASGDTNVFGSAIDSSEITDGTVSLADLASGIATQWTLSGSNVSYGGGNVGIGTASPEELLHLLSSSTTGTAMVLDSDLGGGHQFTLKSSGSAGSGPGLKIVDNTAGDSVRLFVDPDGNVGIGTASPTDLLHVSSASTTGTGLTVSSTDTGGREFSLKATGSGSGSGAGNFQIVDGTANANRLLIDSSGNVGIGTASPAAKLEVNGGVRVNATGTKPTCDASARGTFWVTQGGGGVKDDVEVCAKDAGDSYDWRALY
jgi:hypothetical protein